MSIHCFAGAPLSPIRRSGLRFFAYLCGEVIE